MRRGTTLLLAATVSIAVVLLSPTIVAFSGGVPSGDEEYGCGGSCHTSQSSTVITMTASNHTPAPSTDVTVTVSVSGGEPEIDQLGVMILSALTATNSQPSVAGWTIVSDPDGTTYNWCQVDAYPGSVELSWTLTAPSTAGTYVLYAREMHGGGEKYYNDYSDGLVFTVTVYTDGGGDGDGTTTAPSLVITSPSNAATVEGTITVSANVASTDDTIASATLKIDGAVVSQLTEGPYQWTIDTLNLTEGGHVISITVVDSTGDTTTKDVAIFVDNESEWSAMLQWLATMGAGSIVIISISGIALVLALYIRKRVVDRRVR